MEEYRGASLALRDSVLAVVVSFLLFYFGFGEFIFVFPLLLLASRYKKKVSALSILVEAVLVVSYSFFTRVDGLLGFLLMCFELFIPLSLLAAGATWLATEKRGIGTRLFIALLPSLVFFAIIYVFLEQEPALLGEYLEITENAFEALLSPFINVGAMGEEFWSVFCTTLLLIVVSMIIPVVLCFVCVTCFSYESVLHSRESDWEERVARLELDGRAIWIFLALWLLVLLSRFISIPTIAGIALFNVTLAFTVVYAIQGFSVLYYNLCKRRRFKSYTLFLILLAIALLAPGVNIIVVLGLPLVGVLETFFELRK